MEEFVTAGQLTLRQLEITDISFPLDNFQSAIFNIAIQKLNDRNTYYEQETLNYEDLSNSEEENGTESHVLPEPTPNLH